MKPDAQPPLPMPNRLRVKPNQIAWIHARLADPWGFSRFSEDHLAFHLFLALVVDDRGLWVESLCLNGLLAFRPSQHPTAHVDGIYQLVAVDQLQSTIADTRQAIRDMARLIANGLADPTLPPAFRCR